MEESRWGEPEGEDWGKAIASVLALVEKSGALKPKTYCIIALQDRECLPIFNDNGTMRKVQKSRLNYNNILTTTTIAGPGVHTSIVNLGPIWRLAVQSLKTGKSDDTEYTWTDCS